MILLNSRVETKREVKGQTVSKPQNHLKNEQLLTCFCLLGPRNCIPGSAGACQRREQSGRRSYTRGTAHARLPTTPTGFRQDPVQAQPTNQQVKSPLFM